MVSVAELGTTRSTALRTSSPGTVPNRTPSRANGEAIAITEFAAQVGKGERPPEAAPTRSEGRGNRRPAASFVATIAPAEVPTK
jgi:hypothetical protein